jgi:hypothetical protein
VEHCFNLHSVETANEIVGAKVKEGKGKEAIFFV